MLNNLIEVHAIFADLVTTIRFLYLFTRGVLGKIWLSSVSHRLNIGLLIEICMKDSVKLLNMFSGGGYNLSISKI